MPNKYFAIQEWVKVSCTLPHFTSFFDRDITDYYGWTIPKGEHLIIGAALFPKNNTAEKFELLKRKIRDYGFDFGRTVFKEGAFILRPSKTRQISSGEKGVAFVGEAAGFISPSSAEGFSYAFRSALILSECLKESLDGFEKRYHEKTKELRNNIFLKNVKSRFIFQSVLRRLVMKLGLQSMEMYTP